MLDLRWPIGLMFSLIGALLVIFGAATNSNTDMYAHSLGININIRWGIVLLIFGVFMLAGAIFGKKES
ncbi:MAG TPA: hypothetical protein VH280_03375 [Verrucomicrobiae bacterium]|jgi:ABC-type Fe3+-siderophore transport system permease subunit|nr:hypothetical protein [Verrucomicrobiae bacterium]